MTRRVIAITAALTALAGCADRRAVLADLTEARRLAADMHVEFMKAAEASNRAVMSDTDEASKAGAEQAIAMRNAVSGDAQSLRERIAGLGYKKEASLLETFSTRFNAYQNLDDQILPLAVENTNLKAQQLSFNEARRAVAEFRDALASDDSAAAARAQVGVLEILAAQAPHIAEADDAAMTRMEADMAASAVSVRRALAEVSGSRRAQAAASFDTFMAVNAEIVKLSRRNSNVRSLALALGQKRTLTAECEAQLEALTQALAEHEFRATR